jgi:hypothetical protein
MLAKVTGSRTTAVIFMGDIWKPRAQWDSRSLWMPVEIGGGKAAAAGAESGDARRGHGKEATISK